MSKHKSNTRSKSKPKTKSKSAPMDAREVILFLFRILVSTYCCMLFIAMPVIYHNKYYDIGEFKYTMFMYLTVSFLLFSAIMLIVYLSYMLLSHRITKEYLMDFLHSLSVTDIFALAFAAASILSFLLSSGRTSEYPIFFLLNPDKDKGVVNLPWEGYKGWNMGLRSQLMFVSIYFLSSRLFLKSWKKDFLYLALGSGFYAFLIGVLHRFLIDPLALYENLTETNIKGFLSTLGQATWYSSYMVIIIPIGMSLYLFSKRERSLRNILLKIFLVVSAATFVTQNSDSAFMAFASTVTVMFAVSFANNERFLNFVEMMLYMLASMKVVGIFQMLFPDRVPKLDKFSFFVSKSVFTWIVLAAVICFYIFIRKKMADPSFDITRYKKVRTITVIALICCLPLGVLLAYLNTKGLLPTDALSKVDYMTFSDRWGSTRGFIWRNTIELMREDLWKSMWLTGPGPDCFVNVAFALDPRASQMLEFYNKKMLVCCHNEWLNMLFNEGVLGFVSYLGIFASAAVTFARKCDNPVMTGGLACILAYFFHNMFCYQQILCTPMIFVLMGLCMWAYRDPSVYTESK